MKYGDDYLSPDERAYFNKHGHHEWYDVFDHSGFCKRCKRIFTLDDDETSLDLSHKVQDAFFHGVHKHHVPDWSEFCGSCYRQIIPKIVELRDVVELDLFINKLKRAIDEKRNRTN